jgi:hypothetical protein
MGTGGRHLDVLRNLADRSTLLLDRAGNCGGYFVDPAHGSTADEMLCAFLGRPSIAVSEPAVRQLGRIRGTFELLP